MNTDLDRERFSESLNICHNIIRDNDKLSPEAAFDEISKVLFVKIRYERKDNGIFTEDTYIQGKAEFDLCTVNAASHYYQYLFDEVKEFYHCDQIFEPNDRFRIRENSFCRIVKELEYFNLSTVSDDFKGMAFEKFLGTTFRGELGQFFTPRPIVNFMVRVLNPQEGEAILDPCCGSGGFIIRAFDYIRKHISQDVANEQQTYRIKRLATECIFGIDANPRMARTAKMNMIMHGDGHSGVHHHDGLVDCENIFEGRFDVILTNPPFGAKVSKKLFVMPDDVLISPEKDELYRRTFGKDYIVSRQRSEESIGKPIVSQYDLGKSYPQTEVLFLERCLRLLRPGGRMGIVLPEGVMNNTNMEKVRHYVEDRAKILLIVSLPKSVFVKSGADVKTSILFLRKFTEKEKTDYQTLQEKFHNDRQSVKSFFNYDIPIAEINTPISGALEDANFKGLLDQFVDYCEGRKLW